METFDKLIFCDLSRISNLICVRLPLDKHKSTAKESERASERNRETKSRDERLSRETRASVSGNAGNGL